jgi:hypothetical protein
LQESAALAVGYKANEMQDQFCFSMGSLATVNWAAITFRKRQPTGSNHGQSKAIVVLGPKTSLPTLAIRRRRPRVNHAMFNIQLIFLNKK